MSHTLEINSIEYITHDVVSIKTPKPDGYTFAPGQATEVSVHKEGWKDEKRPFTFTSVPDDDHLEFIIKTYDDHHGVTEQIGQLEKGDKLIIDDAWGAIEYKGKGTFVAGGAGVTPFISIFRDLHRKDNAEGNKLIFSNKTERDIILHDEFKEMLGDEFVNVITDVKPESDHEFLDGHIDKDFLEGHIDDTSQSFYVCGPQGFNEAMISHIKDIGAEPDALVFEK